MLISRFAYLSMILVGKLLNFDFVLALKSPPMITASLVLNWNLHQLLRLLWFCIEISTNDYGFSGFEWFDYRWQLFMEVTGCLRILQGGFKGRCVCTDNVGCDVIVWFNPLMSNGNKKVRHTRTNLQLKSFLLSLGMKGLTFIMQILFGDWCEGGIWVWYYYYFSSCDWSVIMTGEIKM